MKAVKILIGMCFLGSTLAYAQDNTNQTVGFDSSSNSTKFIFDVAGKQNESTIGIRGEMPLSADDRALSHFKERMSSRSSSVEVYGVVDIGFHHSSH